MRRKASLVPSALTQKHSLQKDFSCTFKPIQLCGKQQYNKSLNHTRSPGLFANSEAMTATGNSQSNAFDTKYTLVETIESPNKKVRQAAHDIVFGTIQGSNNKFPRR